MINNIFGAVTAAVREAYNAGETVLDYVIEDVKKIPDSIEQGWNNGLLSKGDTVVDTDTPSEDVDHPQQSKFRFGNN